MKKERLVIVGNGMAGIRVLEELLALAPTRYHVSVCGAEPHGTYNRILLSPVLTGEKTLDDIVTHPSQWYAQHEVALYSDEPVARIDRKQQIVYTQRGRLLPYDRLLLATGSRPFFPLIPGNRLPGVIGFRDIADVHTMIDAARPGRNAIVIGGGLLGLEAASGLAVRGMDVTVVHVAERLMNRQLDSVAAELLRETLENRGLKFRLDTRTQEIVGTQRVEAVRFDDGDGRPADLVVIAAGIQPNTDLARSAGLPCERGVLVNDTLQTFDPRIYAVGECVEHRHTTYGLVAPAHEQARVCASHLAGIGHVAYRGSTPSATLKVSGIQLFSAGDFAGGGSDDLVYKDFPSGVYKRVLLRHGAIVGIVLYGDTQDGAWYLDLMQRRVDVSAYRHKLIFGRRIADAAAA